MCEENVLFVSQPLKIFEKASLGSNLFDSNFSLVAIDIDGNVRGFVMCILRRSNILKKKRKVAVLKFLVVEKTYRYKGLGTKMFNLIHQRIETSEYKCSRMKFIVMASQPDYWFPGLDPRHTEAYFFLKKQGFKKGKERINLCVDLAPFNTEPVSEHKGFKISRATLENREELVALKFMPKGYQLGFWGEEIELSLYNDPITTFIAKDQNGKIIAWATHSTFFLGSFGPTGVKKSLQGKGLGGVLLNWCLWDIKQMGEKKATIMWVEGDTVYFYLKSKGARICEFYWTMKRKV